MKDDFIQVEEDSYDPLAIAPIPHECLKWKCKNAKVRASARGFWECENCHCSYGQVKQIEIKTMGDGT